MICRQIQGAPAGVLFSRVLKYESGTYPHSRLHTLPVLCMHCAAAPCLRVCPTGATRREADGPAENLVLQWDEAGLLRGITSRDKSVDIRYAYTLDDKGNWTERQEQAMIKRFGVLVPQAPATVRRIIAYRGDER